VNGSLEVEERREPEEVDRGIVLSTNSVFRRSRSLRPNGRIQAEHVDGVRENSFIEGGGVTSSAW
jgi:hypothetical protein